MNSGVELHASFRKLGLRPDASWDEVKSAFRHLARSCHPDVAGPQSARRFQEITSAYMTLKTQIASRDGAAVPQGGGRRSGGTYGAGQGRSSTQNHPGNSSFWARAAESWESWRKSRKKRAEERVAEEQERLRREERREKQRERRISGIIAEAEERVREFCAARHEEEEGAVLALHLERLRSRHPLVRALAVDALLPEIATKGVCEAFEALLADATLSDEELRRLLDAIPPESSPGRRFASVLSARARSLGESQALYTLKWLHVLPERNEFLCTFLSHASSMVVGEALVVWSRETACLLDEGLVLRLLRRSEEQVLVPLLRLLKRSGENGSGTERPLSPLVLTALRRLLREHPSSSVRVWAKALVERAFCR
ncbi:DnaJ domain-containing protein [Aminiphilus circumscriptus]|jgi:curved DNA-binding protein CbpA|uniref:DnaJ domain-containing protein n=1 Tax=Aminiphilus circumscriptus TaxID=290732 RepID=UPI0004929C9A|nr:DnaJ domain-containing protein [Aminiphilus circumscriptus]